MTVQLALTPDGRWEFAVAELVTSARRAGFTAVGIDADRVDAEAVAAYSETGLTCHEALALVVTDDAAATIAAAEILAERAHSVGATWVLTVFTAPPPSELIARCARLFDAAGAGVAVEFSPLGPISTIGDGLDVVRAARSGGRAGLMIDSWHFSFSDSGWEQLAAVPLDDIAYVQFTDALEPEDRDRLIRETLHRRALPGDGVLDLDRFAATLLDRGWHGVVSAEVLSAELRTLPVDDLVRRLYDTTARFWC